MLCVKKKKNVDKKKIKKKCFRRECSCLNLKSAVYL